MEAIIITHVIFDLSGTLLNVVDVITEVLQKFAESYGKILPKEIENDVQNLDTLENFSPKLFDSLDLDKDIDYRNKLIKTLHKEIMDKDCDLIPGVDRLVKHLYRNNIPMAIATNMAKHEFKQIAEKNKLFFRKYFSHYVCGADDPEVKSNKPNPDVYTVCAKRFQTKPKSIENCVIVEDSMTGITGAVASGMKTVLINDRTVMSFESIADKITVIVDKIDNFKPESIGLPAFE